MKAFFGLVLLMALVAPTPRVAAQAPTSPEQQLIALENDWSQATVNRDYSALRRFYAAEFILSDEDGVISNKAKAIKDITTGTFRLLSYKYDDMRVHIYGDVAVVTGQNTITGRWEDVKYDITGPYRFTDVFVMRDGRWQCVASQSSRIRERDE